MQNHTLFPFSTVPFSPWMLVDEELESADPLPDIPILPSTRLQLELLVQEPVLDLGTIARVISEDLGATLQILRLVGEEFAIEEERPARIEDCIASLNADTWFETVCAATLVHDSRLLTAWHHASRIGYFAEQLAAEEESLRPGQGHLIGLLHEVGRLPELLGWQSEEPGVAGTELGSMLAEHWHLPGFVLQAAAELSRVSVHPAAASGPSCTEAAQPWSRLLRAAHLRAAEEEAGTGSVAFYA